MLCYAKMTSQDFGLLVFSDMLLSSSRLGQPCSRVGFRVEGLGFRV